MKKVVFMGLILTRHGIELTEEKVRAIVEASQPQSPSEVRSFLGLVGSGARFMPDFATTADPLRKIYLERGAGEVLPETQRADCRRTCPGIL